MRNTGQLIKKYLSQAHMMQIATSAGDQPWVCTVYFVTDDGQNLYWLSLSTRRHSQEIKRSNKIAVAIAVKFDKNPIIGIQAEGTAEAVNDEEVIKSVLPAYIEKYGTGRDFIELFKSGKNQHWLYKFTPDRYYLFDEINFSDGQKHEWKLNDAE
jgi:uncharacterized protein YhbP (UPF0306 family)